MLIDTHCHIQSMIKKNYTEPLQESDLTTAATIIHEAEQNNVSPLINIGSSPTDNHDSIMLAQNFETIFIVIGLHPNDCSTDWKKDFKEIKEWMKRTTELKIVGIGECGIDKHYPSYNLQRQQDAFKAQIELALEHNLALVVHSRDAYEETLYVLENYKHDITRAVMHCFSYDRSFAHTITSWNFALGIGGSVTYPKNNELRMVVQEIGLQHIVLETDSPFLPPQTMRGKQNHPKQTRTIAEFIAQLRGESFDLIAEQTTQNALSLFNITKK